MSEHPTQSAMEQQQRETCVPLSSDEERLLDVIQRAKLPSAEAWLVYESLARIVTAASELRSLRMTSPTTAAMDLARSALREQAERIRVLEAVVRRFVHIAQVSDSTLEFSLMADDLIEDARAALNKEQP